MRFTSDVLILQLQGRRRVIKNGIAFPDRLTFGWRTRQKPFKYAPPLVVDSAGKKVVTLTTSSAKGIVYRVIELISRCSPKITSFILQFSVKFK